METRAAAKTMIKQGISSHKTNFSNTSHKPYTKIDGRKREAYVSMKVVLDL